MALDGVSGSGKTFTALRFAFTLGERVAIINTESGAVEKYLGLSPDGEPWQFDVGYLPDFSPTSYTTAILQAGKDGYEVLIIDSLSHAWAGAGGALELKDKKGGNSFTAWKDITPMHNRMVESILHSPCHVITTMRSKSAYVVETDDRGRSTPRKVGMEPVQRGGMEYEFDIYGCLDSDHVLKISKSRCPEVSDAVVVKPGASFMAPVVAWLNDGSTAPAEFFAVTEEDLRKHEKRVADDVAATTPPPPKQSVEEVMREAAERAEKEEAKSNGSGQHEEAAATTIAEQQQTSEMAAHLRFSGGEQQSEFCNPVQRAKIEELFSDLNLTADQQVKAFEKRKASSFRNLTTVMAADLISALCSKLSQVKAAANAALPPIEPGIEKLPAICGPCTPEQERRIKASLEEWKQIDREQADLGFKLIVKGLHDSGRQKLLDLSANDAARLYDAIQTRTLAAFFQRSLETWKPIEQPKTEQATATATAATAAA